MPLYEFYCYECDFHTEEFRKLADYTPGNCPECGRTLRRIVSAPNVHYWGTTGRTFPNVVKEGDGTKTFYSPREYQQHLDRMGMREIAHDGILRRPHGNTVLAEQGPAPAAPLPPGTWD